MDKSFDSGYIDLNKDFQGLGINSIHLIKLIVALENRFDIDIDIEDELLIDEKIRNIETLVDYINTEIRS
ncbi:MAG: acyl carrier protein [bacterium]|nr:acyl carrier protein [bacterium]